MDSGFCTTVARISTSGKSLRATEASSRTRARIAIRPRFSELVIQSPLAAISTTLAVPATEFLAPATEFLGPATEFLDPATARLEPATWWLDPPTTWLVWLTARLAPSTAPLGPATARLAFETPWLGPTTESRRLGKSSGVSFGRWLLFGFPLDGSCSASPMRPLFSGDVLAFRPKGAAISQPRVSDHRERRPGLVCVQDFEALKGWPYSVPMRSSAPSGLSFPGKSPTQGFALGWLMIAPLGLKTQRVQLQNSLWPDARSDLLTSLRDSTAPLQNSR